MIFIFMVVVDYLVREYTWSSVLFDISVTSLGFLLWRLKKWLIYILKFLLKGTVLYGAEHHIHNYSTVPLLINKIPIWLKLTGTFSELITVCSLLLIAIITALLNVILIVFSLIDLESSCYRQFSKKFSTKQRPTWT